MVMPVPVTPQEARLLVGRVLLIPESTEAHAFRPELRLRIIQVTADAADPTMALVGGIRIDRVGREFEGRTVRIKADELNQYVVVD